MSELDADGIRDYELSPDGEQVADLQFADDGSLWLATMNREKFDHIGKVIKLEGSTTPTVHNWTRPLDVTGDKLTTPIDALIVIGVLNGLPAPAGMLPDTNADTRITALDALLIINRLNTQGSGEGEAHSTQDSGALAGPAIDAPSQETALAAPAVPSGAEPTFSWDREWETVAKRRRGS